MSVATVRWHGERDGGIHAACCYCSGSCQFFRSLHFTTEGALYVVTVVTVLVDILLSPPPQPQPRLLQLLLILSSPVVALDLEKKKQ